MLASNWSTHLPRWCEVPFILQYMLPQASGMICRSHIWDANGVSQTLLNWYASKDAPPANWFLCPMMSLDDPPEISCKDLTRIACIRQYLEESYKNGVILQVQKSFASFLKESCKETPDLLNRHFLKKMNRSEVSCKNLARSCKK